MRILAAASLALLSPLPAQSLQLTTENVATSMWQNHIQSYTGNSFLPVGPITFPTQLGSLLHYAHMILSAPSDAVNIRSGGTASWSSSTSFRTQSDLVTRVTMASPARIELNLQNALSYTQIASTTLPTLRLEVDLYADGLREFYSTSIQPSVTSTLTFYCDDVGTDVRWQHQLDGPTTSGGGLQVTSDLTLQFDNPTQEVTYGPSCAGKLGCQVGAGTYDRVFVASLPGNTTFAWLMGGDQQWNVMFQGFNCPVLVNPQFILAVPLVDGPNGRKFVDFPAAFPAIPGLTFYAQGIAVSGNTFIGTNGVRVQT